MIKQLARFVVGLLGLVLPVSGLSAQYVEIIRALSADDLSVFSHTLEAFGWVVFGYGLLCAAIQKPESEIARLVATWILRIAPVALIVPKLPGLPVLDWAFYLVFYGGLAAAALWLLRTRHAA